MTKVKAFYEKESGTLTYVVWSEKDSIGLVIDPVLNYEPAGSMISRKSLRELNLFLKTKNIEIQMILETHAHADHLSGSQDLKKIFPKAPVAIGEKITEVQETFKKIFNFPPEFSTDGSQFDLLLKDQQTFQVGSLEIQAIHTPGHTPACYSFLIEDCLFVGDALFMPDFGVGRCDFPQGSAENLYDSIHSKIYSLPNETRVFTGHDYQPGGRELRCESSVYEQKRENIHVSAKTSKAEFIKFRTERDQTLSAPKLLYPSIQFNIAAGRPQNPESNELSYLKIPLFDDSKGSL